MSPLAALRAFRDRCALLLHQFMEQRRGYPVTNRPDARHHLTRADQPRAAALTATMRREREQRCTAAVAARIAAAAPAARVKAAGRPPARARFATALRTASSSLAEASHTARARARKTIEQHKRTHPAAGPRHSTRTPGATAEHHDLAKRIKDRLRAELAIYNMTRAPGENSIFTNTRYGEAWT